MDVFDRYRMALEAIVSHDGSEYDDAAPRMFNLVIKDRVSHAQLNAYLVGSQSAVQAVVGRGEFLQFVRLTGGADDVFGSLVVRALRDRGIKSVTPYVTFVQEIRLLKPPKPD